MSPRAAFFAELLTPPLAGLSFAVAAAIDTGRRLDFFGALACLFGIAAAYFFDKFRDTYKNNLPARNTLLVAGFITCGFILLAVVYCDRRLLGPVALLSFLALFYVPLKRFFLKNLLTAMAWVIAVTLVPIKGYSFSTSFILTASMFCIVFSNTLLCDVVDVVTDRQSDIPSLAVLSSVRLAMGVSLFASCAGVLLSFAADQKRLPFTIVSGIYLVFSVAGFIDNNRVKNKLVLDMPLLLPGLLAIILY